MKFLPALALLSITATTFAESKPWPMPSPLPSPLPGPNEWESTTVPSARIDWLRRVQINLEKARQGAGAIDWVLDGDSITDFWQREGRDVFAKNFGNLRTLDVAISGDRTQHVLWRLSQGQVDGLQPKLVSLMIGTNNLAINSNAEIAEGVAAIVADYRKRCPDGVILLQAIFPRGASPSDPARARIKEINGLIAKLADGKHVVYLDFSDKFLQPDGSLSPEIMPDFLHPSAKGYEIWAEAIRPVVERYVPAPAR